MSGKITIFDPNRIFSDNFVNSFFSDLPLAGGSNTELEMYEDDNNVVVKVKAPGFKADDLDISVEGKMLTISGAAKAEEEEEDKKRKYYYKEIRNESFTRSVALPSAVKSEETKAEFKDGMLHLTLPKKEEVKPKKIQIKAN